MTDTADSMPATPAPEPTSSAADSGSPAPATAPAEPSTSAGAAPAQEQSVLDSDLPEGIRQFDRSYVEKVRGEAATNRARARELEEQLQAERQKYAAFDGYGPEDMQVWELMATEWKEDPAKAAQTMQTIAMRVLGDPNASDEDKADAAAILDNPAGSEAAEGLTEDKIREIVRGESQAEREEREREEAVQQVFTTIQNAGYEDGSPESFTILWYANNRTEGDIEKAIEMYKQQEQSVIDRYVQQMAEGGTPVRIPANGDAGSPMQEPPRDMREARRRADAWLAERRGA